MPINHPTEPSLKEASITIGSILVPLATSTAIRVALSHFLEFLSDPNALGDDESGKAIRQSYINQTKQALYLIHRDIRG